VYCALGDGTDRLAAYRALFAAHIDDEPISDIREATCSGHALGDERFVREMEARTGTRLRAGKPGPKPKRERSDGSREGAVESEFLL
jgi:putative transposase